MAKAKPKTKREDKNVRSKVGTTIGIAAAAAGALAGGVALAALAVKRNADAEDGAMTEPRTDASGSMREPMRYTGTGTPDMAVNYTPGADQDGARVASGGSGELGTAEQRDALAGVAN